MQAYEEPTDDRVCLPSVVVATDSIKNTVQSEFEPISSLVTLHVFVFYLLTLILCPVFAKTSPHVLNPPLFALHLATHFVTKYPHIHSAYVDILHLKWSRISVDGKDHDHAFVRDGDEKGVIKVEVHEKEQGEGVKATVEVGLKDLLGGS